MNTFRAIRRLATQLIILCACTTSMLAQGQHGGRRGGWDPNSINSWGYLTGTVYLSPGEEGGTEFPGAGTIVTVIPIKEVAKGKGKATDTLHVTVGESGRFFMRNVPVGSAYVSFSMMGYEDQAKTVVINPGENKMLVNLKPQPMELEGAVVRESVPPISIKGDTIVFNPAAVKVNKGEMAIDILEQMPGVEVSESSVTVLNETVTNVYIDGSLLFGNAPMRALQNLPATEVTSIKSYQEYANKDPYHKISKNESKERVIDIQTKTKPKRVTNMNFAAGMGYDTDTTFHKMRYIVGGEIMNFSEKLQLHATASVNNINDASIEQRGNSFRRNNGGGSADLRSINLSLNATRKWMSPTVKNYVLGSVNGGYSYSDQFNVTESMTERIYFPNEKYNSRKSESSSYNETGNKKHNFNIGALKTLHDGSITAGVSYSIADNASQSRKRSYNWQDDLAPQGTASSTVTNSDSRSFNVDLNASKRFNQVLSISGGASYGQSQGDSGSTKIDTTTSTITNTVLDISTGSKSHSIGANFRVGYELSDRTSVSMSYKYSDSYSESLRWAYDVTDPTFPVIDSVNTQLRINANNSHTVRAGISSALIEELLIFNASINYSTTGINRTDNFPDEGDFWEKRYNKITPSVKFHSNAMLDNWSVSWNMNNKTPSLDQIRPRLDNSNLYSVSAGNPNLKQSTGHEVQMNFNTIIGRKYRETIKEMKEQAQANGGDVQHQMRHMGSQLATFEANLSFNTMQDVICSYRTYFTEATYMPEYNYTMPAQSTFSTYANAGSSYSANGNIRLGIPIGVLGITIHPSVSGSWDRSPSYVDGVYTITQNVRPTAGLSIRSTFSSNIRLNLSGNASYIHSETNTGGRMDYFTEAVRAGAELNNIFKIFYFGGNYTKTFMQGIERSNINDNILDLNGGVRFGPKNQHNISIKVHDLFNKATGFSTSTSMDYVTNSWTHNFGRYVLLRYNYRFNQLGGHGGYGRGR